MTTTDGQIVQIALQIHHHLWLVQELVRKIEASDHPNKAEILRLLNENYIPVSAWPEHVIRAALAHPQRWQTGDFGIRYCAHPQGEQQQFATKEERSEAG